MCGIFAIVKKSDKYDFSDARIQLAFEELNVRGPDASSTLIIDDFIFLGHKRLSIIDLSSASNQPFTLDDYSIIYNGEIYNFAALKSTLKEKYNKNFKTSSDTEVILAGYILEGVSFIKKLRGMFSIIIYHEKTVTFFRDSFGIKPLYKYEDDDKLVFSSDEYSLRHFVHFTGYQSAALSAFAAFGFVPDQLSILTSVESVEPGIVYRYQNGSLDIVYDELLLSNLHNEYFSAYKNRFINEAEFERQFVNAIERSGVADVPLILLLSSGIDSGALACVLSKHKNLKCITLQPKEFSTTSWAESLHASKLANKLNLMCETITINNENRRILKQNWMDEITLLSDDGFNTYVASKEVASRGAKVAISGTGGDELFCGYKFYFRLLALHKLIKLLGEDIVRHILKRFYGSKSEKIYNFPLPLGKLQNLYLASRLQRSSEYHWDNWFKALELISNDLECRLQQLTVKGTIRQLLYLDQVFYLRAQLLKSSDINSMAHSIELRVPIVDLDILRLSFQLPMYQLLGKFKLKRFLNKRAPAGYTKRKKSGFAIPTEESSQPGYISVLEKLRLQKLDSYGQNSK